MKNFKNGETSNMYPNLRDQQQFRLNKIKRLFYC